MVDGEVMIIDEFTGRILEGRRWSEGLHQAVEAKEGVAIGEENQTLATITLQNYFRLYDKLSGMTGTALTEATEFMKIYKVPVVEIPTNQPDGQGRPQRPDLQNQGRQVEGGAGGDRRPPRTGPADPRRHRLGRGLGDDLRRAEAQRDRARGAQREARARPARGRADRRSRSQGRGDDRHQHGGSRRRHQARRRPRAHGAQRAEEAGARAGGARATRRRWRRRSPSWSRSARPRPRRSASWAASTSAAPSGTNRAASTTSCAAAPVARATPARPASSSPPKTT